MQRRVLDCACLQAVVTARERRHSTEAAVRPRVRQHEAVGSKVVSQGGETSSKEAENESAACSGAAHCAMPCRHTRVPTPHTRWAGRSAFKSRAFLARSAKARTREMHSSFNHELSTAASFKLSQYRASDGENAALHPTAPYPHPTAPYPHHRPKQPGRREELCNAWQINPTFWPSPAPSSLPSASPSWLKAFWMLCRQSAGSGFRMASATPDHGCTAGGSK